MPQHAVAVLDDDPSVRVTLERNLRRLGISARTAASPLELVRCLEDPTLAITTVIVDLALYDTDGVEVATVLRTEYPHVRRVVMSGSRFADLDVCVASQRAHAALRKPWTQSELARALGIGA